MDGIFTADPKLCTNAVLLETITPDEAAELTYYGSEVIHPFTMEQVIRAKIPIKIKNAFNPSAYGTLICPEISLHNSSGSITKINKTCETLLPTAVTIKDNV